MEPLEIFRMIAPEFKEVSDDDVLKWMELAKPFVSRRKFGKAYCHALAYLTAHKLKMSGHGDSLLGSVDDALRVSSYSEGETSISFSISQANNLAVDAEYSLTSYGLQFLSIRRSKIISIVSSGER